MKRRNFLELNRDLVAFGFQPIKETNRNPTMRDKLCKIVKQIEQEGSAPRARLTVLKSWFTLPQRLMPFGLWIAYDASKAKKDADPSGNALLKEARTLLHTRIPIKNLFQRIDPIVAKKLHDKAAAFHKEFKRIHGAPDRLIHSRPLFLVEKGLALHIGLDHSPADGYRLAADWAEHHDPAFPHSLTGPSATKLKDLIHFVTLIEDREETAQGAA